MKRFMLAALSALCLAVTGTAQAQDKYPSKPVKIIVPYAPGGATDIVARILGEQMRQMLGQSFVVENKPGAFGIIAVRRPLHRIDRLRDRFLRHLRSSFPLFLGFGRRGVAEHW